MAVRRLAVNVSIRRFPPILPPFLPISLMNAEICAGVAGALISDEAWATGDFNWPVDSSTTCRAHWLTSVGLLGLLVRFGMAPVWHTSGHPPGEEN